MDKKKKHTSHEEGEERHIVNEPVAGYHTENSSCTSVSSMPAQYSIEEFERYLDSFEEDLTKENDCFYTNDEVTILMKEW